MLSLIYYAYNIYTYNIYMASDTHFNKTNVVIKLENGDIAITPWDVFCMMYHKVQTDFAEYYPKLIITVTNDTLKKIFDEILVSFESKEISISPCIEFMNYYVDIKYKLAEKNEKFSIDIARQFFI